MIGTHNGRGAVRRVVQGSKVQGAGRVVQQHGRNVVRGAWCMVHGAWRRVHGTELDAGAGAVGAGTVKGHFGKGRGEEKEGGRPVSVVSMCEWLH